ncbi:MULTISPECIES: hypothetical protein [unclassified Pseudomonas]|uniref:hypothetical protein n=1 Tax=unclassified Pseudomonas TaxID=196821 RepID=UPI0039B73DD5
MVISLSESAGEYFSGECREMILILVFCGLWLFASLILFIFARDTFAEAFLTTTLVLVSVLSITSGSLLVRDASLRATLVNGFSEQAPEVSQLLIGEVDRIVFVLIMRLI